MEGDAVPVSRPDERLVPSGVYHLSDRAGGTVEIEAFLLDRHPVTVDRYARFVAAGGYGERAFWDRESWAWREEHEIEAPRFWDDPNWPLWRRFLRPPRPVVGVSWYEAKAFCRFEGRRLPTEREWEAAARGFDGWIYPWGNDWEEGRIAVRGVGPRVTWPVGWFPRSAGPFGHHDLAGNIWQWTSDPFDEDDPRGAMTVRGGSWASRPEQNRCDHWNGYLRGGRHSHVGFRTAALRR
jgi:formylglycine-generating enzyme required for sulfatase activity